MELTLNQKSVIERLRKRGMFMVADSTEAHWRRGEPYYLDDRTPASRQIRKDFAKGNEEAVVVSDSLLLPYRVGYVADAAGNYGSLEGSFVFFVPDKDEPAVERIMAYDLGRFIRDHADALTEYRVSYKNLPSDVLNVKPSSFFFLT